MRTKNINLYCTRYETKTRVYPFFDKVAVTNFVTPTGGVIGGAIWLLMVMEK